MVKNLPENADDARDMGSITESGRSSEEGNGNPLQYSCLENQRSLGDYSPYYWKKHSFDYMNFCQ